MRRILFAVTALSAGLLGCGDRAGEVALTLPAGSAVLAAACGDLDGDRRDEPVRLVGRGAADSPFREGFALVVGRSSDLWPLPAAAAGYGPTLQLVDVTGDGAREILVVADTGGSGGMVAAIVVSARRSGTRWDLHPIFDSESGPLPTVGGSLTPGFAARLEVTAPGQDLRREHLDLHPRRTFYLQAGVYSEAGTLARDVEIWGGGLMALTAIIGSTGAPGLQLIQQARGASNADRLAEIRTQLTWQNDHWQTTFLDITPLN